VVIKVLDGEVHADIPQCRRDTLHTLERFPLQPVVERSSELVLL
jgi:hypothetical protein